MVGWLQNRPFSKTCEDRPPHYRMASGGYCRPVGKARQGRAIMRPAFRPLRPILCRERHGRQEQALTGRFAALDTRAFLPAIKTCGRGTETPSGACSGNTTQRQRQESQNPAVAGLYRTTPCKSRINALRVVFAALRIPLVALRGFLLSQGFWEPLPGCPAPFRHSITGRQ